MRRIGIVTSIALLAIGWVLLFATVNVFAAIAIVARGLDYAHAMQVVTSDPFPLGAAQLAALGAVIGLGLGFGAPGRSSRDALGLLATRRRYVLLAALAGASLQLPMVELTTLLSRVSPWLAHPAEVDAAREAIVRIDSPMRAFSVPFTFVVIAPAAEELLFRGLIQRSLRARYSAAVSIFVSALLFGAFHGDPQALVFATLVGVVLGALAERSGSTLPSIALHAGFNAMPVLFPEALVPIPGFNTEPNADVPIGIVLGSTLVAVVTLALLARMLRRDRDATES